jgi:hypothetical protein
MRLGRAGVAGMSGALRDGAGLGQWGQGCCVQGRRGLWLEWWKQWLGQAGHRVRCRWCDRQERRMPGWQLGQGGQGEVGRSGWEGEQRGWLRQG